MRGVRSLSLSCLVPLLAVLTTGPSACTGEFGELSMRAGSHADEDGWRQHRLPSGVSLELPAGWTFEQNAGSGRVVVAGSRDEELLIWPVFLKAPLDGFLAGLLLEALLESLGEGRWEAPERHETFALRTAGTLGEKPGAAVLTWASSASGTSAILHVAAAPTRRFGATLDSFARVLQSLQLHGPAEKVGGSRHDFVVWKDPKGGAFSVELPRGWIGTGGSLRPNSILAQVRVEARSPDGEIYVYLGDAFPWFIEPNAFVGPGQTYHDPMGSSWPVQFHAPGTGFLKQYMLPQRLGRFEVTEDVELPDLSSSLRNVILSRYHAGEMRYRFQRGESTLEGTALCITEWMTMGGFASWRIFRLALVESPPERSEEALDVLARLADSFRVDPGWLRREAARAGLNSGILSEMNRVVSEQLRSSFESRQHSYDRIAERGARARLEVEEVVDLLTGERIAVSSGARYYWIDPRGKIFGTGVHNRPTVDYRELLVRR